jgi:pimeloyl-ACP methyl ester carboxylesterase
MITVETQYQTLSDGRTLAYCKYGDPQGAPVFYAHGGPGSRLEAAIFHDSAARQGFCLISTDRPGMGQSTFKPDRELLDYPKDILELAGTMGIEKFGVIGWSGGGAHTVVCGYSLASQLLFNIVLCGYTNFSELPGAADMLNTKADRISVGLSRKFPPLFQLFFDLMALSVKYFPEAYYNEASKALNSSDREIMADPAFKAHFIADQKEAFLQGSRGVTLDAAVHYVDWGVRLSQIPAKIHVFHGDEDRLVPVAFGKHLAENLPNCEFHLLEKQGHLFPVKLQDLIFEIARLELKGTSLSSSSI